MELSSSKAKIENSFGILEFEKKLQALFSDNLEESLIIKNLISFLEIELEDNFLLFQRIIMMLLHKKDLIIKILSNNFSQNENSILNIDQIHLFRKKFIKFISNEYINNTYESDLLQMVFGEYLDENNIDVSYLSNHIQENLDRENNKKPYYIFDKLIGNKENFKKENNKISNNKIYSKKTNKKNQKKICDIQDSNVSILNDENNYYYNLKNIKCFIENIFLKNNYKSKAEDLINLAGDPNVVFEEFDFKSYIEELYNNSNQNYYLTNIFNFLIDKQNYENLEDKFKLHYLWYIAAIFPLLTKNQKATLLEITEACVCNNYNNNNKVLKNENQNDFFNPKQISAIIKILFPFNEKLENYLNLYFKFCDKKEKSKLKVFILNQNISLKDIFNFIYLIVYDQVFDLLRASTKLKIKFLIWLFSQTLKKNQTNALKKNISYALFFKSFYCKKNLNRIFSNYFNDYLSQFHSKEENIKASNNLNIIENYGFFNNLNSFTENFDINNDEKTDLDSIFNQREFEIFEKAIVSIKNYYAKYSKTDIIKIIITSINQTNTNNKNSNLNFNSNNANNNYKYARKFIFRILKLTEFKSSENYFNKYKSCLMKLEKEIMVNYQKFHTVKNDYYTKQDKLISNSESSLSKDTQNCSLSTSLFKKQQTVFNILKEKISEIKNKIFFETNISITADLIPFGSITQFLGNANSDIDLLLVLKFEKNKISSAAELSENLKIKITSKFLYRLFHIICEITNNEVKKIINNRLFTYTFELNRVKVDINFNNFFGVLNSTLLRSYALIDNRFLILVHFIKKLLEKLAVKNTETDKNYVNSYSWALILISYLQNLKNPILPKLLEYDRSREKSEFYRLKIINKKVFENLSFPDKQGEQQQTKINFIDDSNIFYNSKKTTIANCVSNLKYKNRMNEFYNKTEKYKNSNLKNLIKNYLNSFVNKESFELSAYFANLDKNRCLHKFLKNAKNEMTISEIFLNFIEFFIFYFEFEYNFISVSYHNEGFCSRNSYVGKRNEYTHNFFEFRKEFVVSKFFINNYSLIRDPFDHTYNPVKVFKDKFDEIKKKFKNYYFDVFSS